MRFLGRTIGILCLLNTIAISMSVVYGMVNPVPVLNWNTSTINLHDTRTGVIYSVQNPEIYNNSPSVSGVEIMPSPDDAYSLSIFGDPTGLNISLSNQDGENILQLESNRNARINNIGWIDARHFIVIRVSIGNLSLSLVNVETLDERSLGTYGNTSYTFSPNREWLLLVDNDNNDAIIQNFFDERRYTPHPIPSVVGWSEDGRYLASRALLDGELGFQLLDTQTGTVETADFVPNRLAWSSNNHSLITYDRQRMLFYKHHTFIMEHTFSETFLNVIWSYDGNYALLILEANDEKVLYIVDNQAETNRFLGTIPEEVDERSILWSYDSHAITYILPNSQANGQSSVFIFDIEQQAPQFLTYIPATIPRAFHLENMAYFGDLP